jgi:O-antigen ligase
MGWHAMAVCIISFVLAMTGKTNKSRMWLVLSGLAVFALLVCGRRKMVYMLPTFVIALGWLYWQSGRQAKVWSIAGLMIIPLASVWIVTDLIGEQSSPIRYYTETRDETLDRFQDEGFRALYDTYDQSGFFGEGLGTATPGSQNLKVERPRYWQESAPSRILVELGVLGSAAFAYVMLSIVRGLWRVTRQQVRMRGPHAQYIAGLVAFFIANVGSLMVSGQILADPFIAVFLGLLVGMVLSFARPAMSGAAATKPANNMQDMGIPEHAGAGLKLRR